MKQGMTDTCTVASIDYTDCIICDGVHLTQILVFLWFNLGLKMIWFDTIFVQSRWVQVECRRLGDIDNPEVSELLKTAVRCLKERPILFKYCAEEVSLSRADICHKH